MNAHELRCPGCFAPVAPDGGAVSKCRYCGATIALDPPAAAAAAPAASNTVYLECVGHNKIAVIKVVREHIGLGLKESLELVESAPCVVGTSDDPEWRAAYRRELMAAGARAR
jgi:large subunit ribosomal protein L7/L12